MVSGYHKLISHTIRNERCTKAREPSLLDFFLASIYLLTLSGLSLPRASSYLLAARRDQAWYVSRLQNS